VVCSNNDGVWNNEGAKVAFDVQPAWYQTMLFRTLAFLLGTLLVVIAYYQRLSRYAARLKIRFDERLEERTRLARDLHDTLLQTIQGSKLVADNARGHAENREATIYALDRLSEWLERAIDEGREALEALRTSVSDSDSLTSIIHRSADDCTFDSQMKLNISTHGMDREFHPIALEEIYRIGYEAIRNACAHSGGTELKIELHYRRRFFELNISDNGRGMDVAVLQEGKAGHYGVIGMRERAASLGGTLNITSTSDLGTTVSLRVPGNAVYLHKPWFLRFWIINLRGQITKYLTYKD
jgi:signal transduction histidine kinase